MKFHSLSSNRRFFLEVLSGPDPGTELLLPGVRGVLASRVGVLKEPSPGPEPLVGVFFTGISQALERKSEIRCSLGICSNR